MAASENRRKSPSSPRPTASRAAWARTWNGTSPPPQCAIWLSPARTFKSRNTPATYWVPNTTNSASPAIRWKSRAPSSRSPVARDWESTSIGIESKLTGVQACNVAGRLTFASGSRRRPFGIKRLDDLPPCSVASRVSAPADKFGKCCLRACSIFQVLQPDVDTVAVGRQSLFSRHETNVVGRELQRLLVVTDDRRSLQKVVCTQTVGEASRSTGGQDVRGTGHVITDGDRRIVAKKDRPGVLHFRQNLFRPRG